MFSIKKDKINESELIYMYSIFFIIGMIRIFFNNLY